MKVAVPSSWSPTTSTLPSARERIVRLLDGRIVSDTAATGLADPKRHEV